eukprot:gnl/Hemi2/23025_TR7708_c0_g2_i1.p2 gnl/Hemi2/23025_TR7708_c0_g2~~gnl/Hemi2/23025_TR7708_c0_g2_i1.p2  ORF type:complete len:222 (+),score=42.20 gnl/Hemi2/23025_TR7708_c0_g2_i1:48-713(+)
MGCGSPAGAGGYPPDYQHSSFSCSCNSGSLPSAFRSLPNSARQPGSGPQISAVSQHGLGMCRDGGGSGMCGDVVIEEVVLVSAEERRRVLDRHNEYRRKHHAQDLLWSDEVATHAQAWADHLARTETFDQGGNDGEGQSLAMGASGTLDVLKAIDNWYSEVRDYEYGRDMTSARHFTQLVWAGTRLVGVGVARSGTDTYVVAHYHPPGNWRGEFAANVLPP